MAKAQSNPGNASGSESEIIKNGSTSVADGKKSNPKVQKYVTNIVDENGNVDSKKMKELRKAIQNGDFEKEDLRDLNEVMATKNLTEEYEAEMKKMDFGKYLENLDAKDPVKKKKMDAKKAKMERAHSHHVLFKSGNGKAQKALVEEGQAILRKYGIDPVVGPEVLVWAPNIKGQHTKKALEEVVEALRIADKSGRGYPAIVKALNKAGIKASSRVIVK